MYNLARVIFCILVGAATLYSQPNTMTFSTLRVGGGGGASKDWTAESVDVTITKGKLSLVGYLPTGRSEPELKYQRMAITVTSYTGKDGSGYLGSLASQSYFTDIFSSSGKTELYKTTYVDGTVVTTTVDKKNMRIKGTFTYTLTSTPPLGNSFKTYVQKGVFDVAYEDSLSLEVQSKKNPIPATAGEKQKTLRMFARDKAGNVVEGVAISVVNPLDKATTLIGKTASDGSLLYRFDVPADAKSQTYTATFSADLPPYKKSVDVVKVIEVSSRYWIYKCGGIDLITFDAGDGKEWKKVSDASALLQTTADIIQINDLVKIQGKIIIDPTAGQESVRVEGDLFADNVPMPPSGAKGRFTLSTGSWTILPNCNNLLKYAVQKVKCKEKLTGGELSLDELTLVDLGFADALRIKGSITWPNNEMEAKECSKSDVPAEKSLSLSFLITTEGIQEVALGASNLVTKYIPHVCLNEFGIKYNWYEDAFVINGFAQINTVTGVSKLKGAYGTKHGNFDSLYVEMSTDCKPVPDTPLCIDGGKLTLAGWANTTWKDQSVKALLTFKSDEEVLKQRFPPLRALFDKIGIAALEVGGKWQFPRKFSVLNTAKMFKDEFISVTKPWQMEFAQGPCEIDLDKGLSYSYAAVKAGHFGADDFFITADAGTATLTWSPTLSFELSSSAKLRIPDIPASAPKGSFRTWLEGAKATGRIPKDLGNGKVYLNLSETKGVKFEAYVDLTSNPDPWFNRLGKTSLTMSNDGNGWHFSFGNGITALTTSASHIIDIQSAGPRTGSDDEVIQAVPLDTFTVSSDMQNVSILIKGATTAPSAYLINPTGTKITATLPDSSVTFLSATAQYSMIALNKPAAGSWVLGLDSPKPDDSVTIVASVQPKTFSIAASQTARTVKVTWDPAGYSASDSIRVFLDNNASGEDGFFIGSTAANSGSFQYVMTDSLTECTYHVYARRDVAGQFPDATYATGEVTTAKTRLAAPSNIVAFCNQLGITNVSWSASSDATVTHYIVSLRSMFGTDSTIAVVEKDQLSILVQLDTTLLRTLHVTSTDFDGHTGCPGIPQSIALGVDDDASPMPSAVEQIVIAPNPSAVQSTLHYISSEPVDRAQMIVCDILGRVVAQQDYVRLDAGLNSIAFRTDMLQTGTYSVHIVTDRTRHSGQFAVVR